MTVALVLDVVETDDDKREVLEERFAGRDVPLETGNGPSRQSDGVQVEMTGKLRRPLVDEMRRTQNGQSSDLATIKEFPSDKPGLNGLSDADVIRHQQPSHGHLERHQEWDELIGTR